jgi:steroid delta-isomerase-like uncharacterized protein
MSGQDNKTVVRRYYEEVFNQRMTGLIDHLAVEAYIEHDPFPGQGNGRADLAARDQAILGAFSPLQFRLEDLIAEDDRVVARWSQTGTHTGAFMGILPTGRQFTITGIDVHKLEDGRMAEHWHVVDLYGLLQQLGAIPAPDATPA